MKTLEEKRKARAKEWYQQKKRVMVRVVWLLHVHLQHSVAAVRSDSLTPVLPLAIHVCVCVCVHFIALRSVKQMCLPDLLL